MAENNTQTGGISSIDQAFDAFLVSKTEPPKKRPAPDPPANVQPPKKRALNGAVPVTKMGILSPIVQSIKRTSKPHGQKAPNLWLIL